MNTSALLYALPKFKGKETIFLHNQGVSDIIQGILSTHNQYKSDYDKICLAFNGATDKVIGKKIWLYLKHNIKYVIEPDSKQMLKSPAAIISTGQTTGSDCKNYSLFTGGVLDALNRKGKKINWCYRFSSYRLDDKIPQHVFVVINPNTSNEIWVDAVLPTFNNKKQYYYKIDKKIKPMLVGVSGIPESSIGKARRKGVAKDVVKKAKKDARKKHFQKVKQQIKKRGRVVLKFSAAPARNSFLLLVKINVRGLATNLKKLVDKNPEKLKQFWINNGGNWNALLKEIERGSKKRRLLGIGVLPAAAGVAAAITAATPLIIKVTTLFKAAGINGEDLAKVAGKGVKAIANKEAKSIDAAAAGEDVESDADAIVDESEDTGESIEGIGARKKAKKTPKKTAKKEKRTAKKTARKEKRTTRKKKAPKGGFGEESEIDKIDKATTKKVKKGAIKKAATILKAAVDSGLDLADTTSEAVQKVKNAASTYADVADEAGTEEKAIEQTEKPGGEIDNKMLLIGGAVAVGALVLLSKKKK